MATALSSRPGSTSKVWLNSLHLIGAALVLASAVVALGLAFIAFERREARSAGLQQMLQLSKLMAHQTDTDLEQVKSTLLLLASEGRQLIDETQEGGLQALVVSIARGLPQLRSLSVLDEAGRVLGSTTPANLKAVVDPSLLGALPQEPSRVALGPLRFGRDLDRLQRDPSPGGPAVLPMLVRLASPSGPGLILVALLNTESFSTFYTVSANDSRVRLALSSYQGELLLATPNTRREVGSQLGSSLPAFRDYLPGKEWGSYSGAGLDAGSVLAGFVTLSEWPLVMLAEIADADAMAGLAAIERWAWTAMLAALSVIAAITLAMCASLRRHEAISRKLHGEVDATLNHYRELAQALELQKRGFDEHGIVSVADADEVIDYANDKLIETLGYSRQELIGRRYHEFRQRMPQSDYDALRACLAQGRVWRGELAMRRRDGRLCWLSSTVVPVRDEQGAVTRFITVQTDISELRQAEMELARAHDRELQIGTRIQQSLLGAYGMHDLSGLWLSTFNRASRVIDGDFVDVIRIGEHCLDIVAGDVMGKGVPAALLGAATKLQFSRSLAEMLVRGGCGDAPPAPADIVAAVHRVMTPHLQALEAFVTLVYLRVDSRRGMVSWVGCGHEESLLVRQDGSTELLSNQHPPMGVLEEKMFMQDELPLHAGEALFLCSDGLADATCLDGERVGRERVNQTVVQVSRDHASPAAALHSLRRAVLHDGVQLNDDVTMVMLMCPAVQPPAYRCELAVEMASLRPLREFVSAQALQAGLAEERTDLLTLACVEVFTNIVRYGKGLLPEAPVECIARRDAKDLVLELVHPGEAFTPKEPVEIDLDSFPEGGFGMTIIRSACDRLDYLHHAGVNTVRMTLHLDAGR